MADASTPPPPPPPPSPTTWGAFSSLYSNLSAAEVCHLEKAIELRYLGRYDDAEIIYANELPPARQNPVIAIELATIHERTGDEPCRAQIFRETLDAIEQGEITPPEDVHRYLRILLASSHLYVLGQLRLGFEEARGLRTWLLDVEPHTYTDTMVASVCEYHQIIRQTRKASNWCGPEDGDLPHTGGKEALASLQHLRKLLVAQGRINLAGMVAVQESKTANGMDACSPYRELLDAKQVTDVNDDRPLFYKNLTHQLFLSEAMFAAGMSHHGHALFQAACDEMTASEAIYGQPNRFWILADYTRAEIFPAKPGLQRVSQYHDLAMLAESRREKAIQRWGLMQAYQASEKLVESEESRKDTEGASRIRQASLHQYLHFEMTVTRSPYFSAACLGTVGMHMNSNDQAAEWLEYHRDFWNTWPEFDIPLLGRRLFDEASRASRATGDFESAGLYDQQRDQFLKHCSFIVSSSDTRQDDVFVEDAPDDHFSEWMQIPPGMNHDSPLGERFEWISAKLILRWISNDLTANCITMQDIRSILAISHESIEEMEFEDRPLAFISSIAPHELRSRIFGRNGVPTRQEEWGKWFENVETWLQRKGRPPSNLHRHHLLEQIMEARVLGYQRWAVSLPHSGPVAAESILNQLQMADKRLRLYETIDPSLVNLHKIQACKSWKASALMLLANDPELRERGLGTIESLREASLMFEELVSQSRTPGRLRYLYRHLGSLGRCAWMRYFWYKDATPELGMPYWEEADDVFRRLLSGSAYLADFQCFFAKNLLQEELDHAQVFSNGLKVSLVSWLTFLQTKAEEIRTDRLAVVALPRYQELVRNFVKWSQRAKARCLTDVLGLGAQFPRSMMQEIEASPAAMGLVEEMRALEAQLGSAHLSEKIKIRADLRKLQESMRQEETLVPFLDVLEGVTVRHEELQQMCQGLDESVIFLDWLHISWYDNWDIGCALYENGIFVDFIYCNKLKLRDIKTWVQSYLEPDPRIFDMEEDLKFCPLNSVSARKQLKILEPLAAVFEVIPADWLVVICPTYDLCRIPFHAIEFKGRPLIERNPIIYCQSLTILRLCQLSRNSMLEDMATEDFRPVAFNPLGEDVDTSKTVADLATRLGTVTEDLNQYSKEDFVRLLSEASLIHFHGHVRFDHDDPLKHHLELKPVPHDENQCLGPADILTAQEIFGIKLRKGAHITTISCKSARTAVTNNHELLGLAAALHYAGASSIVSALWNIHRNDGRRFSRAFYDALIREMQVPSPSKPYINLARIMQKAVLAVRRDPDGRIQAPYRWAGLVLHGAWLYPRIPDLELETRSNPDLDPHPLSQSDRRGTW